MKEIYIDIDVKYESFRELRLYGLIKQNVPIIKNQFGNFEVWIRRSSSGNVHLRLNFDRDLSVLEHFQVRSLMHDDIYRIGIDLRRLTLQGENEINRIFEMKAKNGVIYRVGLWEDITSEMMIQ